MGKNPQHLYEFGPFRLDTAERRLLRDGEPVQLTPKAFETLCVLVERGGHLVGKDELMRRLWPDSFVEESNLTNNVYAIRKALGEDPSGQRYIETVPKQGYRFTAPVSEPLPVSEPEGTEEPLEVVLERHALTRIVTEEEQAEGRREVPHWPVPKEVAATAAGPRRGARPLAIAMVITGLLVAGAATAFGIYRLISQRQPKESAKVAAVPFSEMEISRLTTSGKIKHAAISPDGQYVTHVTLDAEGHSLWVRHVAAPTSVRVAGPAATEYVSVTFAPDGGSIYYLTLDPDKGHTALYRVPVLGGPSSMAAYDVGPVDFSPDGKQMAFIRTYGAESRLIVASADGTNERPLATRRQPEFFRVDWNAPAWSPDGKIIACQAKLNDVHGQYETVLGVSPADGSQVPLTHARWNYAGQPVWLADGGGLLVTASERATAPAQVWHISVKSGDATRITHDLNNYSDLSLTADSGRLAAVQENTVSSIWVAPEADAGRAKQIASDVGWNQEVAWTPDGRIVYRSNAGGSAEIWVMNADGSNPRQLTADARSLRGLAVSPDGRYLFFASDRMGRFNIWRADADGRHLKQLTAGEGEFYPHCTPDGRWVVYQNGEREPTMWKVPTDGGEPMQLTGTRAVRPAVSPDGRMIAYHYLDPDVDKSRWRIGVVSSTGGEQLKRFDFPPTVTWRFVRWSPDGQTIAYANSTDGFSDIWLQPLDGRGPSRLTNFKTERIIAFDWSRDGRFLAFIRGVETSDVVLIDNKALKK